MRMHAARVEHTRVDVTLARFRTACRFSAVSFRTWYGLHALPVQLYFTQVRVVRMYIFEIDPRRL